MIKDIYVKDGLIFKKKIWKELDSQFMDYSPLFNKIFLFFSQISLYQYM